ncbi:MAG: tRNA 2-thiocytidine biosynthesis protein TtcA [Clostridia bacterium]|nr:tRNA 2-thiocytidine biosynthesis protein TtcA [Clostridia bacterium]
MEIQKELQKILSRVRAAVERYEMIEDGDRIALGISGGKDSLTMLCAIAALKEFLPKKFELIALQIDMGFDKSELIAAPENNHDEVRALCDEYGVLYHVKRSEIAKVIFDIRHESNPCSLCARMRRGVLTDEAKALGCNKIALGHHYDDAAETLMLNLFYEGRIGCFRPVTYLSRSDMYVIRPMILTEERQIKSFAKKASLPVEATPCPEDEHTEREEMKTLLHSLDRQHRGIYRRVVGALERSGIDGWKEE